MSVIRDMPGVVGPPSGHKSGGKKGTGSKWSGYRRYGSFPNRLDW